MMGLHSYLFITILARRHLALVLICLFAVFCFADQASAQGRAALIIANSAYRNATPLPNAVNDGRLMAKSMQAIGFDNVVLVENQDRLGMERALRAFAARAERAEVALVYFAGHGIESKGENYLIPIDATFVDDRDLEFESVKLSTMVDFIEGANRLRLVIIDACRTAPPTLKRRDASRSIGRGLAPIEPGSDSLVVFSAKHGTTAADGAAGGNSPFALAFASRLLRPGREINLLFRDVRDDVLKATGNRQEPFTYGSLSSREFYFIAPSSGSGTELDPEAEAWSLCKSASTSFACERYLASFPVGKFRQVTLTRLKELQDMVSPKSAPQVAANKQEMSVNLGFSLMRQGEQVTVTAVSPRGAAFGQMFSGDVIVAINSQPLRLDQSLIDQLDSASGAGPVQLLIRRGPSTAIVILRPTQ
jgi:hypothetical protein